MIRGEIGEGSNSSESPRSKLGGPGALREYLESARATSGRGLLRPGGLKLFSTPPLRVRGEHATGLGSLAQRGDLLDWLVLPAIPGVPGGLSHQGTGGPV